MPATLGALPRERAARDVVCSASPRTLVGVTSPSADAPPGRLVARTVEVTPTSLPGSLIDLLPATEPMAWLRRGEGIAAWGVAAQCRPEGADRFTDAADWWRPVTASAVVRDEVEQPGSGLVCMASFAFADDPGDSVLVVPQVVVGTRGGRSWITVIGQDELAPVPALEVASPAPAPRNVVFADGAHERHRLGVAWSPTPYGASGTASWRRWCSPATSSRPPTHRWTCAGRCAGWPRTTRCAGPSTSTASSARPRSCWCVASAVWSPHASWPGRSGAPATTSATPASPDSWRARRRTSRSTSTPSARSPSRWRRTAPRRTSPRCRSCCTCPT